MGGDRLVGRAPRGQNVNFGWPDAEGPDGTGGQRPVVAHAHNPPDTFCAIVGGYVVRDPGLPTLNGRYIYGDNSVTSIWVGDAAHGRRRPPDRARRSPRLTSFGEDACGHVYAASLDGPVYRIQDGAVSPCTLAPGTTDTTPPG